MFFLLRLAFWLGLVLLLLPLGLKGADGQGVSVFDALGAAQAVIADARGFCERQPQACAVGGQMVTHLTEKAQVGAKWLYESLGAPSAGDGAGGDRPAAAPGQAGALDLAPQLLAPQSLTPQDLLPAWGGGEAGRTVAPAATGAPAAPPAGPPLPPRRPA
ncbi:DUF5330 domain-containing protein [Xanthobacter sp. AM11]|uniref:DUF5330 domain-containing protein n=1 Tax=Xanthobacter sp. AM11 TaxID=3380643 RepID=UPI0039BF8ECA